MSQSTVFRQVLAALNRLALLASRVTGLSLNFVRFGMVGATGFCWDTLTVYSLRHVTNIYVAGTCGFLVAASANWALNRIWTYGHQIHDAFHRQWLKFIMANFVGFIVNRGCFFTLVSINKLSHDNPIVPIMAGTITGIFFNYLLSKRFVFR